MDQRLNGHAELGIAEGEFRIIRKAGEVVTDDEISVPDAISRNMQRPFVPPSKKSVARSLMRQLGLEWD